MKIKLQPNQIIVLSFLITILIGAFLLKAPVSVQEGKSCSFVDALFTSASATCVTGLSVKDTGSFFSPFGKAVLLCLMQLGGLGIMTFSTMFAIMLGRKLTISHNVIIQSALDQSRIEGLTKLVVYIILFAFGVEALGTALLYFRWSATTDWGSLVVLKKAVFHSVSAFCNCGFSLFRNSLTDFRADPVIILTICGLIVTGGLGFVVFLDIPKLKFWRNDRSLIFSRINLQTKIAIWITAVLIISGAVLVWYLESRYALKGMGFKEKILSCIFTSVTPRTAGFNVLETGALRPATLLIIMILMFIGASPGSTGGGIKTVTLGVLLASFGSMFYNRDRITLFGRTIPREIFRRAMVIAVLSLFLVILSAFILTQTEEVYAKSSRFFMGLLFESTSAFGTVGLSTGITPLLSDAGKLIMTFVMFIGRVGPLTLALAVATKKEKMTYRYPEEKLMVG